LKAILYTSVIIATICSFAPAANADLINRGNGLIYDTVLNITWLQDAGFMVTNNFGVPGQNAGRYTWDGTQAWIGAMNAANYLGYSNWRLPKTLPVNGSGFTMTSNGQPGFDGSYDLGFNVSAPGSAYPYSTASEMAYMYYVNLGNKGFFDTSGGLELGYSPEIKTSMINASGQTISFQNLSAYGYWSESDCPFWDNYAWVFNFGGGGQDGAFKGENPYPWLGWAVLDGDVAPVPERSTIALLGIGIIGLIAVKIRRLSCE